VAVVGLTDFSTILFDDVSAAALDNRVGRNDFKLVFVTFSESSH
jgi:hypothetical protein